MFDPLQPDNTVAEEEEVDPHSEPTESLTSLHSLVIENEENDVDDETMSADNDIIDRGHSAVSIAASSNASQNAPALGGIAVNTSSSASSIPSPPQSSSQEVSNARSVASNDPNKEGMNSLQGSSGQVGNTVGSDCMVMEMNEESIEGAYSVFSKFFKGKFARSIDEVFRRYIYYAASSVLQPKTANVDLFWLQISLSLRYQVEFQVVQLAVVPAILNDWQIQMMIIRVSCKCWIIWEWAMKLVQCPARPATA